MCPSGWELNWGLFLGKHGIWLPWVCLLSQILYYSSICFPVSSILFLLSPLQYSLSFLDYALFLSLITVILGKPRVINILLNSSFLPIISLLFIEQNRYSEEITNYKIHKFLLKIVHTCKNPRHRNNIAI